MFRRKNIQIDTVESGMLATIEKEDTAQHVRFFDVSTIEEILFCVVSYVSMSYPVDRTVQQL